MITIFPFQISNTSEAKSSLRYLKEILVKRLSEISPETEDSKIAGPEQDGEDSTTTVSAAAVAVQQKEEIEGDTANNKTKLVGDNVLEDGINEQPTVEMKTANIQCQKESVEIEKRATEEEARVVLDESE